MAEAGRVIAGSARGTRLQGPGGPTRPFGDRVKEALFAILEPELPGANVLDLFAGSGAAGIEALSRGAAAAWFVERDARAVRTIEANLARTSLAGDRSRVVRADVVPWLRQPPAGLNPFDVVLVDPPYAKPELIATVLEHLGSPNSPVPLTPDAVVVVRHFWRTELPSRIGLLASDRVRRFGETALAFYRRQPHVGEGE